MCLPFDPICQTKSAITDAAEGAASKVFDFFADMLADSIEWTVKNTMTLWARQGSADVLGEHETIGMIRGSLFPIVVAMLVGGIFVQSIRLAIERRGNPLVQVGRGLTAYAVATATGTTLVALAVTAGDEMSVWVIDQALDDGDFADRTTALLTLSGGPFGPTVGIKIALGLLALASALVQGVLMIFRDGAVLILLGVLQLAAAGQMTKATAGWLPRISGWLLAMVCYKPAAALVYAAAFTLAGKGEDIRTAIAGYAMIVLSIVALPVLMRMFTWATGEVTSSGGTGQLMMSAGFALQGLSSMRGGQPAGGWSANQHADHLQPQQGPTGAAPGNSSPGSGDGGGGPGPGGGTPGGPGGGGPSGATGGGAAAGAAGGAAGMAAQAGMTAGQAARDKAAGAFGPPETGPSGTAR